jgi:sugar phosphate isomerase/epimerase
MFKKIYLGSVLLEPRRWSRERQPSIDLLDWTPRIKSAGFDGWDLWEFHDVPPPVEEVRVYNSYLLPEEASPDEISGLAERVNRSGAGMLKFNVGKEADAPERAVAPLLALAKACPGVELLCECHPGTALEDAETAIPWIQSLPESFGVILHPLGEENTFTKACMAQIPGRVRLVHLQLKDLSNGKRALLEERPEAVKERLTELFNLGYKGPATLEFTRGVGGGPEDVPETLFQHAMQDLAFLRGAAALDCA